IGMALEKSRLRGTNVRTRAITLTLSAQVLLTVSCAEMPRFVAPWSGDFGGWRKGTCENRLKTCTPARALRDVAPPSHLPCKPPLFWFVAFDESATDCDIAAAMCAAPAELVSWNAAEARGLVFLGGPQGAAAKLLALQ